MLAVIDRVSEGVLRIVGGTSLRASTTSGTVHAHDVRGSGRGTCVLLHGLGATSTTYTALVLRLRPHARRIVLVDLPGHGKSATPPGGLRSESLSAGVREAIDLLVPGGFVLFGTSLGGAIALRYSLDQPARVQALVLASPAGAPLDDADLAALRRRFDLRTRADARRFFADLLHAPPFYLRALEGGLMKELGREAVQGFLGSLEANDFLSAERLGTLVPPATVLWGKSDRILPRSALSFYRRTLPPGTRVEELHGVGHSPHIECPNVVARSLTAALRQLDA
jgi:pimeloyl-ACP methyl ester carboxylesterase